MSLDGTGDYGSWFFSGEELLLTRETIIVLGLVIPDIDMLLLTAEPVNVLLICSSAKPCPGISPSSMAPAVDMF